MCIRDRDDPRSADLLAGQPSSRLVWVEHNAVLQREAELANRGVAPQVLVGQEQHLARSLGPASLVEGPLQSGAGVARGTCLLYTSDAADDLTRVDLGGR